MKKLKQVESSRGEELTHSFLERYPTLAAGHWTMSVIRTMSRFNYEPSRKLCANQNLLPKDGEIPSYMEIVIKHLSEEMLQDLFAHADAQSGSTLEPEEKQGEIMGSSYSIGAPTQETSAASTDKAEWGAW